MTAWQYAQLVITRDSRGSEDTRTSLWHGPGQDRAEFLRQRADRAVAAEPGGC